MILTTVPCFMLIYLAFYMFFHSLSMLLVIFLLIMLCYLIRICVFNLFSQPTSSIKLLKKMIIKLEINLFNIMVRVSQVLALILAIIYQYIFKINNAFYFLNIIFVFVFLFIILQFTVANTGLYFGFNQRFHKQIL